MRTKKSLSAQMFPFSLRDLLITISILFCAAGVCILLHTADTSEGFASPIFVLAVLLISLELDEIMELADTIGVIYNGQLLKIADASTMTSHDVGKYMMGVKEA